MLASRYGRVVGSFGDVCLEYVLDVVPVEVAFRTFVERDGVTERANVYGAGLRPLGLVVGRRSGKVRPFVGFTGRHRGFTGVVPLPDRRHLDFTAHLEAGVSIVQTSHRAVVFGATLHHISNGGRSATNRGLNSVLVFGGVSIFWQPRAKPSAKRAADGDER